MDTIIIKVYGRDKFRILDRSQFVPEIKSRKYNELSDSEKASPQSRPYLRRFVLTPKNLHQFSKSYMPRVEVFEAFTEDRKNIRYILKIEFSAPKLLYGNSLLEIVESDKKYILQELKTALTKVNILVKEEDLGKATVAAVHFCKNVPLPRTIKMREVLNELVRIDITKAVDVTGKEFKHGARVLNIYSGVVDRSFYDKISDSIRPKNKRSDKSYISPERSFIEQYGLQNREVFRYEYRIKKTQTVKREVNIALKRDTKTPIVFNDLFVDGFIKGMVTKSWRDLIERPENQLALFRTTDKLGLFLHILGEAEKKTKKKPHSMNRALIAYGLACAVQDHGAKEIRRAIAEIWNTDHPERLTKLIGEASVLTSGLPYSNSIAFVDAAVEKHERISLSLIENGL